MYGATWSGGWQHTGETVVLSASLAPALRRVMNTSPQITVIISIRTGAATPNQLSRPFHDYAHWGIFYYLNLCLSVSTSQSTLSLRDLSTYPSVYLPIYLPTYLSTYLTLVLLISPSTYMSIYLTQASTTYQSTYLSAYLSISRWYYLSAYLPTYLPINLYHTGTNYQAIYLSVGLSICHTLLLGGSFTADNYSFDR